MINIMNDILQYVPYALFLGAVFLLLSVFTTVTVNHFRKAEKVFGGKLDILVDNVSL